MLLSLKRPHSSSASEDSEASSQGCDCHGECDWVALQCAAEVLQCLKKGKWEPCLTTTCPHTAPQQVLQLATAGSSSSSDSASGQHFQSLSSIWVEGTTSMPSLDNQGYLWHQQSPSSCDSRSHLPHAPVSPTAGAHHLGSTTSSKKFGATRSYVWRGPSRKTHNFVSPPVAESESASRRDSSLDGEHHDSHDECPSDDEGKEGTKQRDKAWAALTTWLRMNLHHPRTSKRQVLFVGVQKADSRQWQFMLNPELTWDDVSIETKLRLKTLPQETEQAFKQKYPNRPSSEWCKKTQKYRPCGASSTASVPLGDMILSLASLYDIYEGSDAAATGPAVAANAAVACGNCVPMALAGVPASQFANYLQQSAHISAC